MNTHPLLLELLISGFFAVACFKARAGDTSSVAMRPRDLLQLTDRLDRLKRTRWQWCAMVLVIVAVRLQSGSPVVAEFTAALQFVVFLALPVKKESVATTGKTGRKTLTVMAPKSIRSMRAG
jgi:hypothetical protein